MTDATDATDATTASTDTPGDTPSEIIDARPQLFAAMDQAHAVIAGIAPEQMGDATPCDDWDVRTLAAHLAYAARRAGQIGRRDPITEDGPSIAGVSDDQLADVYAVQAADARAAWADDATLDGEVAMPWGAYPAWHLVGMYAMEQVTHAWDLAVVTGQLDRLDPELSDIVFGYAQMLVPAGIREGMMPFAEVVAVDDDADPSTRLAAWMGRNPAAPVG